MKDATQELVFPIVRFFGIALTMLVFAAISFALCQALHVQFWRVHGPIGLVSDGEAIALALLLVAFGLVRLLRRARRP